MEAQEAVLHPGTPADTEAVQASSALPRRLAFRIALAYLAFGILWVFSTDRVLQWLGIDPVRASILQTGKGCMFVAGSALLVYVLLTALQGRNVAVLAALLESRNEISRINAALEQRVTMRTRQLESANRELEAFAYAVSHDLRAPLRSMSGFSQILQETAPAGLDAKSQHYLQRIHDASMRMSGLIEDLLSLSRLSRTGLQRRAVNLSELCLESAASVRDRYPGRDVTFDVAPGIEVNGDARMLRIAIDNLLDNAWKYSAKQPRARITVGTEHRDDELVYFVRDDGVGFDMAYAGKLFGPFQRLHAESQFSGTGIGLVTVQRIVAMHDGRVWADAAEGKGATFFFTLGRV
jgi:light-regulated signal transduction histidine kinase (bacteriophytochrome)